MCCFIIYIYSLHLFAICRHSYRTSELVINPFGRERSGGQGAGSREQGGQGGQILILDS
jgi:hypothetical protein